MKLTPWYPDTTYPVRKGIYEINPAGKYATMYAYWNGKRWGLRCFSQQYAYKHRGKEAFGPVCNWRGLSRSNAASSEGSK